MKKIEIIYRVILHISIFLFIATVIIYPYGFSYLSAVFCTLSFACFAFSTGLVINKKERYKKNIKTYMILYFVLLLSLTVFINRVAISFIYQEFLRNYHNLYNLIPFKTIINYITGPANIGIKITNILGNLVAFIPLSILLIIKDKKYCKIKNQIIYIGITVFIVELLQFFTSTGRLDIDDFILNVGGVILFVFFVYKFNLMEKMKKLFYQDFHLSNKVKYGIWIVTIVLVILADILLVTRLNAYDDLLVQTFYVSEKDNCSALEKIEMEGYHLYLDCVDVVYETEDNYQMSLQEVLENGELTRKDIKEKLEQKETLWDGGTATYVDTKENIAFVLCRTTEGNKDIYVGNKNVRYEESFCK